MKTPTHPPSAGLHTLFQKFDQLADMPDAVGKIRELILRLAVQGKLIPQDPKDEPASELLKEIRLKRSHEATKGKARKTQDLPPIKPDEIPYELPKSWEWVRLSAIASINPRNNVGDSTLVSFVSMTLIPTGFAGQHGQEERVWGDVKQGFTHFAEGDIGVAKITPCFENSKACVFSNLRNNMGAGTTELHIIRPVTKTLSPRYVLAYLKSPQFLLVGSTKMTGTAGQKRLPKDFVESNPFPLPPLAEQHRIVAKVDELMAQCDRLEAQLKERETKQAVLARAALARFAESPTPENLELLFHDAFAVSPFDLRKTILTLAVQGKLVSQDPNDEPASELLKEIEAEKNRLVKAGKIKQPKPLSPVKPEEVPYELPKSWQWVRISSVTESIDYGTSEKTVDNASLVPVYRMGNIVNGQLRDEGFKYISPAIDDLPRLYLKNNDILFNRTNSYELVGKTALYIGTENSTTFASYLIRIRLIPKQVLPIFISLSMNSPYFRETQIEPEIVQQCGQANFNGTKLSLCLVPLPPLAEQHRIIAKVDQLMALVDAMENQITSATDKQTTLLTALMAGV